MKIRSNVNNVRVDPQLTTRDEHVADDPGQTNHFIILHWSEFCGNVISKQEPCGP